MTRAARGAGSLHVPHVLAKKRDGGELSTHEIESLIAGFVEGRVADYQMSAFAMAVYLQGMTARETAALTLAMARSGSRAKLRPGPKPTVDKHSTGGVGDKVSICLAPMVAAAGAAVPMISGRGLGHTGGTLDKLAAIPGFRVDVSLRRFERLVQRHGFALIGQTSDLAPADRKLYALRDVTATVESIPLITASILSKKLCEDLDALVLDVKVGRGAFMKTLEDARALARSIVSVGKAAGLSVTAVLTHMDAPLGRAIGNALETREALELLHGRAPDDLLECTLALGREMLVACGLERSAAKAERKLLATLADGSARAAMQSLVGAQGGDPRVVDEPQRLPRAPHVIGVRARRAGYVRAVDALALGQLSVRIGAGRSRADERIDPRVGIVLDRKPGEPVEPGDVVATLHLADRSHEAHAVDAVASAFEVGARRPVQSPLVVETHRGRTGRATKSSAARPARK